ncbi:MAG: serine/threonine protein kinase [Planctomycetota bacterium]|nr:serine/threonine protein kinase [Planctomycetota bacterium]
MATTAPLCSKCGSALDGGSGDVCSKCLLKLGLSTRDDEALQPGQVFHGLEIERKLGAGGMGVVYKARQANLERSVAIKVLPRALSEDPEFTLRFMREARALAALNHPNIVAVYDFGEEGGRYFFVMEFVDGTSLRPVLDRKAMTAPEAIKIVPMLCDALEYAHAEGVVHRDIKPENILIDKKGRVKIADFGLAKLLDKTGSRQETKMTQTNVVMGTPHYMAPEQYENAKSVDHRADIYSMGVLFYEMLTGELPIGRFPPPSQRVQVDVRLDEIVLRALEKQPEKRYQTMGEVSRDVTRVTRPPSKRAITPEEAKSGKWDSIGYAVMMVAFMLAMAVIVKGWPWGGGEGGAPDARQNGAPAPAGKSEDPSAEIAARGEKLLKEDQPSLAFEILEKRIHEDPENQKLRALAVQAAGRHLEHIVEMQGREAGMAWLEPQLREKSFLRPLAERYAVLDTESTVQTLFDKGRAQSFKLADTTRELLAKYPQYYKVPCAAAAIIEKYNIPESVLSLYREAFKRGLPKGDAHAWEICLKAFAGNKVDDSDGKYIQEFAREFYKDDRVDWAQGAVELAGGFLYLHAYAILKERNHPKSKDAYFTALANLLEGHDSAAAQKTVLTSDASRRKRAHDFLAQALETKIVPETDVEYLQNLVDELAK